MTAAGRNSAQGRQQTDALKRANALHRAGQLDEAEQAYRALVVDGSPEKLAACAGLGELLLQSDRYPEAIGFLQAVATADGASAEALNNLGYAHFLNGTYEFGLQYLQRANALDADKWLIQMNLGQTYLAMDNQDKAAHWLTQASELNPSSTGLRLMLANALSGLGDFARARPLYESCLDEPGRRASALSGLVRLAKQTRDSNLLVHIEEQLTKTSEPAALRALHFAAAKTHLDLGDSDAGFAHLKAGKASQPSNFERRQFLNLIAQSRSIGVQQAQAAHPPSDASPIFIIGMPRCGSSLTEQILSGHQSLFGAGERQYIPNIARRLGYGTSDPAAYGRNLSALPPDALPAIANGYLSLIDATGANGQRSIDKLLHNFLHVGLIRMLFPNARIIHCKRQPLDCCLSIYMSPFEGHGYAEDLSDLGWYYRQYEGLMAHWVDRFPDQILTVNYEDTVADIEGSARRILDFLSLPWDPRVLNFTENERGVSTASKWQVRQPLYRTSVDRWRQYEDHLGPLIAALEDNKQTGPG